MSVPALISFGLDCCKCEHCCRGVEGRSSLSHWNWSGGISALYSLPVLLTDCLCGENRAQAEVERSEREGEAQGRPVVGGTLRFWGVGVCFVPD